ncbi:MAG: GNAT family N-acetyltransferase [Burkholderiaceae bacterium]
MNGKSKPAVRIELGDWKRLGADAARVRTAVFVDEQKIPASLEWDAADAQCLHCVAYLGDAAVGTGRLLPDAHIGRMAVLAANRRLGIGDRILDALVRAARARGDRRVELSSQAYVTAFYARHGFVAEGDPYEEAGIPHQRMALALAARGAGEAILTERSIAMPDGSTLHECDWSPPGGGADGIYLLHGLGEHVGRYDALARWWCARGWRVRAHDHVGHGRSSGARGVVARGAQLPEHAAARFDAFAADLGRTPALLGHSLGGALAAELVVVRGLRPRRLVLSSPALATGLSGVQRVLLALLERVAPSLAIGNGLDPDALSHDPAVVRAYLSDPLVHDRICARLLRWLVDAGEGAIRGASALAVPTLLMVAGADRLVDPSGSRRFADAAPAGRLTLAWYDAHFHEIFNERAGERDRVLADLDAWIAGAAGG